MKQHITRAYNSFAIDKDLGIITKTSKETRLKDEINYYKTIAALKKRCTVFFPRMLFSYKEGDTYGMELEYYAYDNLGDYMVYRDFDEKFWLAAAATIQTARKEFLKVKRTETHTFDANIDGRALARAMYIDKTEKYYYDLVNNFDKFGVLCRQKRLVIDGKQCRNFEEVWPEVLALIKKELMGLHFTSIIHGDFCFSNILCGTNRKTETTILKFVDPRGSFGTQGIFGDPLYDAAKLLHSYEGGYEYIIYDKFNVEEDPLRATYDIQFSNDNKNRIAEIFGEITSLRTLKSKLIEGLIYIGMCSRHYDSEARQTAMYLTGIKTLNEILEGDIK